ncbi:cell division protein ZapD [Candidatus Vallotia tarda]|uniref:Cell division protein ZapD n=1 Tax=Candidatus Vallotiella hemipterorum TaxID=1177213 RepID=A0A916JU65_9BURK|nr:cell division protein ZapD [Candidatus Vallotia tarda]CAG7599430.1 Cell division protein ZapD [Candidatus Vallotia tarda]
MILYEYPLNERIRTLLRLEDLFDRFTFFLAREDPREHHVALTTLFEITEVTSRSELKSDLMKELERQRQTLESFRGSPGIKQDALEIILTQIEKSLAGLSQMQGKTGQNIANNEWLTSIRSRAIIPGATCRFDLPAYYAWQRRTAEERRADIVRWAIPLMPLRDAIVIILRLARESGQATKVIALHGSYQQMLSRRIYQLMRVCVAPDLCVIPEASANKYMLWVRFTEQEGDSRPRTVEVDVPFQLVLCTL